jgi:hypothetical protein
VSKQEKLIKKTTTNALRTRMQNRFQAPHWCQSSLVQKSVKLLSGLSATQGHQCVCIILVDINHTQTSLTRSLPHIPLMYLLLKLSLSFLPTQLFYGIIYQATGGSAVNYVRITRPFGSHLPVLLSYIAFSTAIFSLWMAASTQWALWPRTINGRKSKLWHNTLSCCSFS